jgi:hypothetical protein
MDEILGENIPQQHLQPRPWRRGVKIYVFISSWHSVTAEGHVLTDGILNMNCIFAESNDLTIEERFLWR